MNEAYHSRTMRFILQSTLCALKLDDAIARNQEIITVEINYEYH
jgi:hypothetical protein